MADLDILVFHAGGVTQGARNIALPLLRRTPEPKGLAKNVTVSAAMWTGSHGMRSVVNVRVCGHQIVSLSASHSAGARTGAPPILASSGKASVDMAAVCTAGVVALLETAGRLRLGTAGRLRLGGW